MGEAVDTVDIVDTVDMVDEKTCRRDARTTIA